jgi:dTDP-4-amino-4,6-dideoxygalactose transaminase
MEENKIKPIDFSSVTEFENQVASFFGAKYAIAVDSCTHGIELCLRHVKADYMFSPKQTYISVPFLANKLGIDLVWTDYVWQDWYTVWGKGDSGLQRVLDKRIIDAAVLWKKDSYLPGTFMCLSFQYQKHLSLGRGGMILCDDEVSALELKKMSYDGRLPNIPWRSQNIDIFGYHYYMTPETASVGLQKLPEAIATKPKQWVMSDWPDLTKMKVFNNE